MSTFMANAQTVQPKWFLIDATDVVVGRLAVTISNHYLHTTTQKRAIVIRDVAPDGTMSLQVAGRQVGLGPDLTDNLWVHALGPPDSPSPV